MSLYPAILRRCRSPALSAQSTVATLLTLLVGGAESTTRGGRGGAILRKSPPGRSRFASPFALSRAVTSRRRLALGVPSTTDASSVTATRSTCTTTDGKVRGSARHVSRIDRLYVQSRAAMARAGGVVGAQSTTSDGSRTATRLARRRSPRRRSGGGTWLTRMVRMAAGSGRARMMAADTACSDREPACRYERIAGVISTSSGQSQMTSKSIISATSELACVSITWSRSRLLRTLGVPRNTARHGGPLRSSSFGTLT